MSDTADRVFRLWARGLCIFTAVVAIVMFSYAATGNNLAARVADVAVVLWSFYLGLGVYVIFASVHLDYGQGLGSPYPVFFRCDFSWGVGVFQAGLIEKF